MKDDEFISAVERYIRSGEKQLRQNTLGIEIEHFLINRDANEYVHYFSDYGIEHVLKALELVGWNLSYSDGWVMGASKNDIMLSVEPGSQLEVSIHPKEEVAELKLAYDNFLKDIQKICEPYHYTIAAYGYNPVARIESIPLLPKQRYRYMYEYLQNTGALAHHMMKGTASIQISIDYHNEQDFHRKLKAAHFLSPILYAAFDNAVFFEGKRNDEPAKRAAIWSQCDPIRSGMIDELFDQKNYTYRDYAARLAKVPPIFVIDKLGLPHYTDGLLPSTVTADFPETIHQIEHFMGMSFFDVRVKKYIEIRTIDSLPSDWCFAVACLVKHLFYNEALLDMVFEASNRIDSNTLHGLTEEITIKGMHAKLCQQDLWAWLETLLKAAHAHALEWEREQIAWLMLMLTDRKTPREYVLERLPVD